MYDPTPQSLGNLGPAGKNVAPVLDVSSRPNLKRAATRVVALNNGPW